jgi:hypothetical protein
MFLTKLTGALVLILTIALSMVAAVAVMGAPAPGIRQPPAPKHPVPSLPTHQWHWVDPRGGKHPMTIKALPRKGVFHFEDHAKQTGTAVFKSGLTT